MTNTNANTGALLRPEDVDRLLVRPVLALSVASNEKVSTVRTITGPKYRVPVVTSEVNAAWVAEGDELPVSDLGVGEDTSVPTKVGGVSFVTRELAEDSSPEAQEEVGASLARVIALRLDSAFVAAVAAPAPQGLGSLVVGVGATQIQEVVAGVSPANLDWAEEAISKASDTGASPTAILLSPADVLMLAKLKKATGSNESLLESDPSEPRRRMISGVPVFRVPQLAAGVGYVVDSSRVRTVVRSDARVEASPHVAFTSDRVAVKGTMRVGLSFPHRQSIVKVRFAAS